MGSGVQAAAMIGRWAHEHGKLLYKFNLDGMIRKRYLLRWINVVVTAVLAIPHEQLKPFQSFTASASISTSQCGLARPATCR